MDNIPLKVLFLEDAFPDMEVTVDQLTEAGFRLDVTHVENEVGFRKSLQEKTYDVIFSDFNLPGFDAFGALEISQKLCPEVPFICISGAIGEETAVELMRRGAVDYVLKDRPGRLSFTLKRALKEAEEKAVNHQLTKDFLESEQRFKQVAEAAQEWIWEVDNNGLYTYASPVVKSLLGYTPEEVVGKKYYYDFFAPEEREELKKKVFEVFSNKEIFRDFENAMVHKNGNIVIASTTGSPFFDKKGHFLGYRGLDEDITERVKAEAALEQKSENLAKLFRASSNLNESIDKKTVLQKIVDTAVELIEMDAGAIYMVEGEDLYMSATRPVLPDTYPDEFRRAQLDHHWHIKRCVQTKEIVILQDTSKEELSEQEQIVVKATGFRTLIYLPLIHESVVLGVLILGTSSRLHQFSEEELNLCKTLSNLSTTALANANLFDKNRQFVEKMKLLNRSVEASSVSIIITDADGNINYVNPYFSQLTGYAFQDVLGKNPRILNSGQQPEAFYELLWNTILSGKDWRGEIENKKQNGELYWEKAVISPILDSKGEVTHFVAIKEDITDRKRMLEELMVAKEKAEEGDRLKTAFINNISHEIRTPLNGILGFGQLIAEKDLSADNRKMMLAMLRKSSERLMNTVSAYMDIALISSGAMPVHREDFLLKPTFEEILKKSKQLCEVSGLDLIADIPIEMDDLMINSDPEFLKKIMNILIDNAIKFTHKGTIRCGFKIESSQIRFYVRDTGIGIEEDHLKLIFEMFRQEDVSMTRGYEGSGLGLSIAQGLVALLGGDITVESEKGKGSEFSFVFPVEARQTLPSIDEQNEVKKVGKEKPLVLVAEDDELNYLFLETVLCDAGYACLHAVNGAEAVEYCRQNTNISIVFMDMKMPVMGGAEATKKIHEFRPELPVIATTAYAQTGDERRFLDLGCHAYVAKPIMKEKLLSILAKHIE